MKVWIPFFLLVITCSIGHAQNDIAQKRIANAILQKTSGKLNSLTTFSYKIKRELNYASENYHNISEWSCYFNFNLGNPAVGFHYQVNEPGSSSFFNGTEKFELQKSNKTIEINNNPQKKDFATLSYLYNSIITCRNVLPLLIADQHSVKTVSDTSINSNPLVVVTINIGKRRIQNLGEGFDSMQTKSNFIYKISIDKSTNIPVEVLQQNDLNNDFIKTSFTDVNLSPNEPAENSWYYSSYMPEYELNKQKQLPALLSVGALAPDFTLSLYNKNETLSLSSLRGKVILLDFWFKNCSPCIESVPHLNAIKTKYSNSKFEVLGINTWDTKKDIAWFCNKHQVAYTILMQGKDLAERYGIDAFPTMVLISKEGKVLYVGGLEQSKIEALIEKAL